MLKPLGDKVVLRPLNDEDDNGKTKSGIIIPNSASKTPDQEGIIIVVGPDVKSPLIKEGERVMVSSITMKELFTEEDVVYSIIKETDILGIN